MNQTDLNKIWGNMKKARPNSPKTKSSKSSSGKNSTGSTEFFGNYDPDFARYTKQNALHVSYLATEITTAIYKEPTYVGRINEVYTSYIKSVSKSLKSINMKGFVCASLYFILLNYERAMPKISTLINAANSIRSTTAKVTKKMIFRYLNLLRNALPHYLNDEENVESIEKHLKRFAYTYNLSSKDFFKIKKPLLSLYSRRLREENLENVSFMPSTIGAGLIILHFHKEYKNKLDDVTTIINIYSRISNEISWKTITKVLAFLKPSLKLPSKLSSKTGSS